MIRRGANTIIVVGYYYAQPLASIAADHPNVRFTLIDASASAPNIRSVLFREQEGTFLTGVLAAMASRTGTIGFVGAMDIPLVRKFIRSEEHTSELQSLMRISYAVFCLKKKKK